MRSAIVYTGAALYAAFGIYAIETAADDTSDWNWTYWEEREAVQRWEQERTLTDMEGNELDVDEDTAQELIDNEEATWDSERPTADIYDEYGSDY